MRKSLPSDKSFAGLFGPQRGYDYFTGRTDHPFPDEGADPDALRATVLADAALLAYVPERDFLGAAFGRAGFDDPHCLLEHRTFAMAAARGQAVVVAFRGTDSVERFPQNLRLFLAREGEGRVHEGYRDAVDRVWPALEEWLGGRPAWFTGHSLGGGLALVAAARYPATRAVYTFGAPRAVDRAFRDAYPAPVFRFVNHADPVTRLPPPVGFHHVGQLLFFDRTGALRDAPGRGERVQDILEGHLERARETLARWRDGDFSAAAPSALADHAPIGYATHAWNHFVETL